MREALAARSQALVCRTSPDKEVANVWRPAPICGYGSANWQVEQSIDALSTVKLRRHHSERSAFCSCISFVDVRVLTATFALALSFQTKALAGGLDVHVDHLIPGVAARVSLYEQAQSGEIDEKPLAEQDIVPLSTEASISFPMLDPGRYRLTAHQKPNEHMRAAAISMSIEREGQIRNIEVGEGLTPARLHMFVIGSY